MTRPLVATVYPEAIAANLRVACAHAGAAKVLAVIKANAYGHGIARALRGLRDADGVGLIELDAAVRLRQDGYGRPIVLLEGCFTADELREVAQHHLTTVVHQAEQVEWIARYPQGKLAEPFQVFVKINTGMNRLGFDPDQALSVIARLEATGKARVACIMTHFARADETGGMAEQHARFVAACAALRRDQYARSAANSAALLREGALGGNYVRPGIMLYGASPFADTPASALGLRPAMSLASEIIAVQTPAAGECVGYGATFNATAGTRIGVVACGYADGYPRHAPTGTPIAVAGKRTRLVGRVSMDMITVDLIDVPEARIGSPVELWGEHIAVDEVAQAAGTIGYELLCAVAPRVTMRVAGEATDINALGLGVEACI